MPDIINGVSLDSREGYDKIQSTDKITQGYPEIKKQFTLMLCAHKGESSIGFGETSQNIKNRLE